MKKLFMLSIVALLAATGIGCSTDGTDGPGHAVGKNPNAVPVYIKYQTESSNDFTPVICVADINHAWYQCVVKNGKSPDKGKTFPTWTIGGLWTNTLDWDRNNVPGNVNISFDNYGGAVVGVQANASSPIYFSILPKGTLIDENLAWVENTTYTEANDRAPYIWSSQSPEINVGESGYLVGKFKYEDVNGDKSGYYRGWIKVSVSKGSVKVDGMCLCLGGGDFHTGEMPFGSYDYPEPAPVEPKTILLAPVVGSEFNFPAVTVDNNNTWIGFNLPSDNGAWGVAGLWGHQIDWTNSAVQTGATYISIENNGGDLVGVQPDGLNTPIYYSLVPENTAIDDQLKWVSNPNYVQQSENAWQYVPRVWDSEKPEINKGQSGYIVGKFHYRHTAAGIADGYYRGWVKVAISADGAVTASGMCLCIGEGEFKTGQLPENPYPQPDPVGDYVMVNLEGAADFQTTMSYSNDDQFLKGLLGNTYIGIGLAGGVATWGQGIMTQSWGGNVVGSRASDSDPIFYSMFDANTEITDEMSWITPGTDSYDVLATISAANYTTNKGKSGYLVGTFPYENKSAGIAYAMHRGWIEVDVAANGDVSFKRMCVCLKDNYVFKTGQTQGTELKPVKKIFEVLTGGWDGSPFYWLQGWVDGATYLNFALQTSGGTWEPGGVWVQNMAWAEGSSSQIGELNFAVDNYGCPVVGTRASATAPIYFTILSENTTIDNSLAWVDNDARNGDEPSKKGFNGAANFCMTPYIWSGQSPDINKGQSGYIVGRFSYEDKGAGVPLGFYRGWIKVEVDAAGNKVTFDRMYVCVDEGMTFKTGQSVE